MMHKCLEHENKTDTWKNYSYKIIFSLTMIVLSVQGKAAVLTSSAWKSTVAIGFTHFDHKPNQTYSISNYIFDSLYHTQQHDHPSFNWSMKKEINLQQKLFKKISIGPAFYYQKATFTGEVWELNSAEFFNYTYNLGSDNYNLLLEGDFDLPAFANHITPFLSAGLGLSFSRISYNDYAQWGIPVDSEFHLAPYTNEKFIYTLGGGFEVPLSQSLSAQLRYLYTHMGTGHSSTLTKNNLAMPISLALNSQTFLVGLCFRI